MERLVYNKKRLRSSLVQDYNLKINNDDPFTLTRFLSNVNYFAFLTVRCNVYTIWS